MPQHTGLEPRVGAGQSLKGKGHRVNKAELVQALAERLDADRKLAVAAVDGLLEVIMRAVHAGDSVSVTGFGVFERRERAARTARNPRTGQLIEVPATAVPTFRPGATFRDVVSGARTLGEPSTARIAPRPAPASVGGSANGSVNGSVNGSFSPNPAATAVALAAESVLPGIDTGKRAKDDPKTKGEAKVKDKAGESKVKAKAIKPKVKAKTSSATPPKKAKAALEQVKAGKKKPKK